LKRLSHARSRHVAFTLLELAVAASVGLAVLAGLISAAIAIQRSISATSHYVNNVNNGNRLVDYVGQDLRRAVRVGSLVSGTNTSLKNNVSFTVTETNVLTANIPDYYGSNVPNNASGSAFKSSRYARTNLNTQAAFNSNGAGSPLNGCIAWNEAVTLVGATQAPRFAPAATGTGEIQVRYYRGPRSGTDPTVCFFRAEYPSASNTPNSAAREIAERVITGTSVTSLIVSAPNLAATDPLYGRSFNVESNFTPKYARVANSTAGTDQYVTILLRNMRRD
jgi:hypothetical protein